jgi:hypothetical protein
MMTVQEHRDAERDHVRRAKKHTKHRDYEKAIRQLVLAEEHAVAAGTHCCTCAPATSARKK